MDLSFSYSSMGSLLNGLGDLKGALAAQQNALTIREGVYRADPLNEHAFTTTIMAHKSIAGVLTRQGDLDGAIAREGKILELREAWEKAHPSTHGDAGWQASFH